MKNEEKNINVFPKQQEPDTIDLVELFYALLNKWYMLVIFAFIGMILADAYAFFFIKPTYESTAKLYAVSASGDSVVDLTDLNIGTNLTKDYQELIMSYPVLDEVSRTLNLNLSSSQLAKLITLSNPTNTRVLTIKVKTNDAELSKDIANTVAGVAQRYLTETMAVPQPNVAQVAKAAETKSDPSYFKMTVLGGLLGFILIAAYYVIQFITDDTVRANDDIEATFGIPLLASIPVNSIGHKEREYGYGRHKK